MDNTTAKVSCFARAYHYENNKTHIFADSMVRKILGGVFEQILEGQLSVCKVTFGAEPKDYEVWEYILKNYYKLKPSPAVKTELKKTAENPKRRQREAKKLLRNTSIGTKSQQALKMQREEMKIERKQISREQREAEKQRKFELRQQKKKEKHRGH